MSAARGERVEEVGPVRGGGSGGDEPRLVWLGRAIWAVLIAGVLAFLVRGADNPPDPLLVPAGDTSATTTVELDTPVEVDGEGEAALPVTTLPPAPATTAAQRSSTPSRSSGSPSGPIDASASTPAPSAEAPSTTVGVERRPLPGFGEVGFRVTSADGRVVDGVALLAADQASRSQGLMEQSDLRGYDAMVFRFSSPTTGRFFMRNTRIPLSIAFFDLYGRFVSAADMEPCPDEVADCPSYAAVRPYVHAVEVAQGDLPRLGIGPGSVLSFPSP